MRHPMQLRNLAALTGLMTLASTSFAAQAPAAPEYHPINPTMEHRTILLTGHDLTIEQVVDVARYGAQVEYGAGVLQKAADQLALRQEAGAEGMVVYGLNRGGGALREVARSEPGKSVAQPFTAVPSWLNGGALPEVSSEEIVRAIMVISANTIVYSA